MCLKTKLTILILLVCVFGVHGSVLQDSGLFDPEYIDSLNTAAWQSKHYDLSGALKQSEKSLGLAVESEYARGEMLAQKNLSVIHIMKGNYDSAEFYIEPFIKLARELQDSIEISNAYNTLGTISYHKGDLENALTNYIIALRIIERQDDVSRVAKLYNNISNIYMVQKKYDKSLEYNLKSLELKQQLTDSFGMAHSYNNIGYVNREIGKYADALEFYDKALKIFTNANNKLMMANVYANIGETYFAKDELDSALKTFFKVIDLSYQHDGKRERIYGYLGAGKVYAAKNDFKAALPYLEYGNKLALQINAKQEILTSFEVLSEAYAKQNKFKMAYESHRKYSAFKDSIINLTNNRVIDELSEKYESEKKTNTIRVLELENQLQQNLFQRQRAVGFFLISVLVIMVLLAHALFQNNKAKRVAIRQLEQQNIEIHQKNHEIKRQQEKISQHNKILLDINHEKNHFIGIVVHDLRSPLNNIIGLVSLIKMDSENLNKSQLELLDTILDSTKNLNNMIAKILNIQAIESGDVKMDLKPNGLNDIVRKVVKDLEEDARKKDITVTLRLDDQQKMANVDVNYSEQIFTNLLSNALKFSHRNTEVCIESYAENGQIGVVFKDQGPGIPQEDMHRLFGKFQKLSARPTAGEASTGLGLSIVKKYVDAMNGKIWCESVVGEGASFFVSFEEV